MSMFDSEDFDQVIRQVDENQDGKISFNEFCSFMTEELTRDHFSCD